MEDKQDQAMQDQAPTVQAQAEQAQENNQDNSTKKDLFAEQLKKLQSEISGLNRKNNELAKKLKDSELEKLSEEERIKAQLEEARKEKEQVEQEARQFRRQLTVEKMVRKYNLPDNFGNRLQGSTDEEIEADAKTIAEFLTGEVTKRATEDVKAKLSGKAPQGGESPDTSSFQAQYDAARKRGDAALMLTIQRRAATAGEQIKHF
jgi:seryl-tRNA synthetase